ncbi:MAG: hypothetical protein ACRDJ2_05215 [Actinomycetota bacterium]
MESHVVGEFDSQNSEVRYPSEAQKEAQSAAVAELPLFWHWVGGE